MDLEQSQELPAKTEIRDEKKTRHFDEKADDEPLSAEKGF